VGQCKMIGDGDLPKLPELYPKDVLGSLFTDSPFVAELALKSKFPSSAEVLLFVSSIMSKFSIDILALNLTCKKELQYMVFFIDYSRAKIKLEKLIEELRKHPNILDVKYKAKVLDEKIISAFAFPTFNLGAYKVLILGVEEFSSAFEKIKEAYGTGGEALLYHIGKMLGEMAGERYRGKRITGKFVMEDCLAFQAFGWGIVDVEHVDVKAQVVSLKVYNLFESITVKGKKRKPNCHFVRGYLNGVYSRYFNREVEVLETMCIAKGDPYCRFIIRPRTKSN